MLTLIYGYLSCVVALLDEHGLEWLPGQHRLWLDDTLLKSDHRRLQRQWLCMQANTDGQV